MAVFVGVYRQGQLLQVIGAGHPPRGLARGLDRRQQQGNQNADDGDDDQEFDEGKTGACSH